MAQLRCSKVIPFPREKVFEILTDPYHVPVLLKDHKALKKNHEHLCIYVTIGALFLKLEGK